MERVWCTATKGAAIGKTAGTYDTIGSDLVIKSGVTDIIGLLALVVQTKPTAGESSMPILQIDSKDLGISKERLVLETVIGDAIATNNHEAYQAVEFIGLDISRDKKLADAKVSLSLSSIIACTEGWDVCVGLVMADGPPDQDYRMELLAMSTGPVKGGEKAISTGGISATTATAFSETIAVSSYAKTLIGLKGMVVGNAPTAADPCCGFTDFTSDSINDFAPQKWPFMLGIHSILGTPVGAPGYGAFKWFPTRFVLPQVNHTISVAQTLSTTLANAGDGIAAAKYR